MSQNKDDCYGAKRKLLLGINWILLKNDVQMINLYIFQGYFAIHPGTYTLCYERVQMAASGVYAGIFVHLKKIFL